MILDGDIVTKVEARPATAAHSIMLCFLSVNSILGFADNNRSDCAVVRRTHPSLFIFMAEHQISGGANPLSYREVRE